MAYSVNPNLPKARAIALKMLLLDKLPLLVLTKKCGTHRSTSATGSFRPKPNSAIPRVSQISLAYL
jgi:hypothetical protein